MLTKVLLVIVGLAIAGFVALQFLDNGKEGYEEVGEIGQMDLPSSKANLALDENTFLIKTDQDTVIENQDGVIIYIPANAFDTDLDEVELKVQSAIDGADIMLAGLSTMSDSNQLETGGMFYIDAMADGKPVNLVKDVTVNVPTDQKIDGMQHYQGEKTASGDINWVDPKPLPKNLMPVDILSLDFYPPNYEGTLNSWGYNGKRFVDSLYYSFGFGKYEAIGSQSGEKLFKANCASCHRVDKKLVGPALKGMTERWEENSSVGNMYKWIKNSQEYVRESQDPYAKGLLKKYSGSVMPSANLSSSEICAIVEYIDGLCMPQRTIYPEESDFIYGKRNGRMLNTLTFKEANILYEAKKQGRYSSHFSLDIGVSSDYIMSDSIALNLDVSDKEIGINPASIKSIWLLKFNNTVLATKEFEERMPFIHESCEQKVLDLYINNLSKDLSEIDSMAMQLVGGDLKNKFAEFAARGDGKVIIDDEVGAKLSAFYAKKLRLETKAIEKAKAEFWDKQAELDSKNQQKQSESMGRNLKNQGDVLVKEIKQNLCKVYEELDHPYDCNNPPPPIAAAYYTVPVRNLGWHNIDMEVIAATVNRATTDFSYNGKTSSLTYENWTGQLVNYQNYDQVYVYNLPQTFNSYVKINANTYGQYNYKLNADIDYETVVLAWKNDQFFYSQTITKAGLESIQLKSIAKAQFKEKLSSKNANFADLKKELDYIQFAQIDSKRIKSNLKRKELRSKIEPVIFPCRPNDNIDVNEDLRTISEVDEGTTINSMADTTINIPKPKLNRIKSIDKVTKSDIQMESEPITIEQKKVSSEVRKKRDRKNKRELE